MGKKVRGKGATLPAVTPDLSIPRTMKLIVPLAEKKNCIVAFP